MLATITSSQNKYHKNDIQFLLNIINFRNFFISNGLFLVQFYLNSICTPFSNGSLLMGSTHEPSWSTFFHYNPHLLKTSVEVSRFNSKRLLIFQWVSFAKQTNSQGRTPCFLKSAYQRRVCRFVRVMCMKYKTTAIQKSREFKVNNLNSDYYN